MSSWFKQYFISLYTYKYLTIFMINGPESDSKLKADCLVPACLVKKDYFCIPFKCIVLYI